jgi:hypothetical protein
MTILQILNTKKLRVNQYVLWAIVEPWTSWLIIIINDIDNANHANYTILPTMTTTQQPDCGKGLHFVGFWINTFKKWFNLMKFCMVMIIGIVKDE